MPNKLPELKYKFNALEPVIDALTMEIHYTKHHQAYVNNLNTALSSHYPAGLDLPIVKLLLEFKNLPEAVKVAVRNNGGGHVNHTLFWETLSPQKNLAIPEELEKVLIKNFGTVAEFKSKFETAAKTRFGSGWAWLVYNTNDTLEVISLPNQDSPLLEHKIPLLGLDVWEHAYYLNYQNRRLEYISNFWQIVNWPVVLKKYVEAQSTYNKNRESIGCSGSSCGC